MHANDSTSRFSDRATQYHLYRPGYPTDIITWLQQTIALRPGAVVADVGSGTGLFSELFLAAGYAVKGVEPNAAMRAKAQAHSASYPAFESIDGTAASTTLPNQSIDLITVAQAFHWFNPSTVKPEWKRILQPGAYVLLAWNILQTDTPFLRAYASIKNKYAQKNAHPDHANTAAIQAFFEPHHVAQHQIRNIQWRTSEGLQGLLTSSSKVPLPGESRYNDMIRELDLVATQHAENGMLQLEYETKLYLSQL